DLVADACTEQRRRAEAALVRPSLLPARSIEVLVVESLEVLVGHAEVAAQIPAADGWRGILIFDDRRINQIRGVSWKNARRYQGGDYPRSRHSASHRTSRSCRSP